MLPKERDLIIITWRSITYIFDLLHLQSQGVIVISQITEVGNAAGVVQHLAALHLEV